MAHELIAAAAGLWLAALILALVGRGLATARLALALGCAGGMAAALAALPGGIGVVGLPVTVAGQAVALQFPPEALWLMGFGLAPALFACGLGSPGGGQRAWIAGASASLLGALGVFGLQDGVSFLIAWELMSLGGGAMILGEGLSRRGGEPVLFMLGLLELGAVLLLLAFLILGKQDMSFEGFGSGMPASQLAQFFVGLLLLLGFGAKLGLAPFYEWFPGAYGRASGATGALLSGGVLNAAFYGLSRAFVEWLPTGSAVQFAVGEVTVILGVASAVLTVLYAFQQEDWRSLLALSSAENASIAAALLGAVLLFRSEGAQDLAGLAWTVALLHLAGHGLAKGALFLSADAVYRSRGSYALAQAGLLRRFGPVLGVGALFAAMSLCAMPPQAGFVSEWYVFQTVFQGFHLSSFPGRLTLALAGAGLAIVAAVALATFVKVFGIGLLGDHGKTGLRLPQGGAIAVGALGIGVLVLAVGMLWWLSFLEPAVAERFGIDSARQMVSGLLLVPLTPQFAFISPSLLIVVMPLLALIPLLLLAATRRYPLRKAAVWYGGLEQNPERTATTALTFANALRTFYSFVYRPAHDVAREHQGVEYFIRRLVFNHRVAPLFGPGLFTPATRAVWALAGRLRALQSGDLNFYLALIGGLLVIILGLTLL